MGLMLDAAYPPSPDQWCNDMDAVGADAGAIYVIGPITQFSTAHVTTARARNKKLLPIVVPGDNGFDPGWGLSVIKSYGFTGGPVGVDIENFSLPPPSWDVTFDSVLRANGFFPIEYGNKSRFGPWGGPYTDDDELWIAEWIRTGVLNPIPTLPAGDAALQFVNDVNINGSFYDGSVYRDGLFPTYSGGIVVSSWDGSYPMPDPPPAGTTVKVVYSGKIITGARFYASPNGQDMGPAPAGAVVTVRQATYDGAKWIDWILPETSSWVLLDSMIDGSDANHPPPIGQTPVTAWNEANKPPAPAPQPPPAPPDWQAPLQALAAQVSSLQTEFTSLQTAVTNLENEITTLNNILQKVKSDL